MEYVPDKSIKYYKKLLKDQRKYLGLLKTKSNKSGLHKIRVNQKNLKGVHQLVQYLDAEIAIIDEFHFKTNDFYKCAGKIREIQVDLSLSNKYILDKRLRKAFRKKLESSLKKQISVLNDLAGRLAKETKKFSFSEVIQTLSIVGQKDSQKLINQFINSKIEVVTGYLSDEGSIHNMHRVRIDLKVIKSVYNLLFKKEQLKKDILYMELLDTEEKLGKWHDKVVLNEAILNFGLKYNFPYSEVESLVKLLTAETMTFATEYNDNIKELITRLGNFWS